MSANGIWKSRYEHEGEYGDTLWSMGVINVVDGRVYIDSMPLENYLREKAGQAVAFEFVFGLPMLDRYSQLDEKIAPLVQALNKIGVRTLHSCQGHMTSPDGKYDYRCPQVDCVAADVGTILDRLPANWLTYAAPWGDNSVVRLRPQHDAASEEELLKQQDEAQALAQTLVQTPPQ